ncbi:MAG: hypothetical protein KIT11_02735 [Fimbriimonadaceae bacterium]|nr:hypothetical protein [Fimbriimonadaceae bacterium]
MRQRHWRNGTEGGQVAFVTTTALSCLGTPRAEAILDRQILLGHAEHRERHASV